MKVAMGYPVKAKEAFRFGLAQWLVPHDELLATTTVIAEHLSELPPLAARLAKESLNRGLDTSNVADAAYIDLHRFMALSLTEDAKESHTAWGARAATSAGPRRLIGLVRRLGRAYSCRSPDRRMEKRMTTFTYDHIHLRSPDAEATARWYQEMFGAEIIRSIQSDGRPRLDLELGGVAVFIAQVPAEQTVAAPPEPPHLGLEHIGLRVSGIDDVVAELKAKGAEFTVEPKTIRPGVRIAFLRGPQNVHIELLDRNAA